MFKNLSAGAIGVRGLPLKESIDLAKNSGFAGIDFNISEAAELADTQGIEAVRGLFSSAGVLPGQWSLPVAWRDDVQWTEDLKQLPKLASFGRKLGCTRTCTFMGPSSDEREYKENFAWHVARFRPIAEVLRDNGCQFGIEFIGPKTSRARRKYEFIYTLGGLMDLAAAIGTGNVGLLLDAWHLYTSGGSIDDLDTITAKDVVTVHVNDAPAGIARDEQIDNVRALPMETRVIDIPGFLRKLDKMGYDGPVTPEPFSKRLNDIASTDPLAAAKLAAEAMDAAWKAASLKYRPAPAAVHCQREPRGVEMEAENTLIEVKDLKTHFFLDEGTARAVDGVSFQIRRGGTLGVVGESGCGKSVTARSILRIVQPPGRIVDGEIIYRRRVESAGNGSHAEDVVKLTDLDPRGHEIRSIRGNEIAMIFQEPMTAFSPVHTIGNQVMEAIMLHQKVGQKEARNRAIEMLDRVGVSQPTQRVDDYPHQFSGGMRQRAMIAMALSCQPSLLIADEPTTALDVTTEAQILDLMRTVQAGSGTAMMYITHNLGVVAEMADDVVVMYMGKVVEHADVDTIFYSSQHPYMQALLRSIPHIGEKAEELAAIKGMVPDPYHLPRGCTFHPRCPEYQPGLCDREDVPLKEVAPGHEVRCLKR